MVLLDLSLFVDDFSGSEFTPTCNEMKGKKHPDIGKVENEHFI